MTPPHPQNGSRLEITKPPINDHTPNLTGNKKLMFGGSTGKPPSTGVLGGSVSKPSGSKPALFGKPNMKVKQKFQMDVVKDVQIESKLDKIANKKPDNLLKPGGLNKPNFTSSSPMGIRKRDSA